MPVVAAAGGGGGGGIPVRGKCLRVHSNEKPSISHCVNTPRQNLTTLYYSLVLTSHINAP